MGFCLWYSQHCETTSIVPVTLDNPQNFLGTVFKGTTFYQKNVPMETVQWFINVGELLP